jgi:hypothetical protein
MRLPLLLSTMCLLALPVQAKYSGGTGKPNDPYQIATAADLIALGETPEDYDKHFILTADIDLDPKLPGRKVFDRAVIGDQTCFRGVFDGDGHTIFHLTIDGRWGEMGLFGTLCQLAKVRHLGIVDVNVGGSYWPVGALVGSNHGAVTECYSTGAVNGKWFVGGLMGSNSGTVTKCYTTGTAAGEYEVGGLVGSNGGDLTQCYSTAVVKGGSVVGGLVGSNEGTVTRCYGTGAVSGERSVGGLVGDSIGFVTQCYSTGPVNGSFAIGGLAAMNIGVVTHCYSTGSVSGNEQVGGLAGMNLGVVTHCYSTGAASGSQNVGGLVGDRGGRWEQGTGTASGCFWDTQTSGQPASAGGTGRTTGDMQMARTFLDAGWDFVGEAANGMEDIWGILEGKNYPRLAWEFWAFSPDPRNEATEVIQSPTLNWLAARSAVAHDVYFGEDKNAVANATRGSMAIYRGRQPAETVSYDLDALERGKTYYWRIDEVNEGDLNSPWKGTVWSFTTADLMVVTVVDDFESYTDDMGVGRAIFQTWRDGLGCSGCTPVITAGNGTGAVVGNELPPFAEQRVIHCGKQSMPMDYNNVNKPWYSEAERTWQPPQGWTMGGADTLTLYFRGKADNGLVPLYVRIEDGAGRIAVVVHPDAEAVLATEWQKWHIALGEVRAAGVNVAAVQKMVIGVGDRKNPEPRGTGRIYIDDIRLTKRVP